MRRDPHVMSYAEPGPLFYGEGTLPGAKVSGGFVRFRWPEPFEADVRTVRESFPEEGRGLFVLRDPFDDELKYLVEGAYPEEVSARYAATHLDPARLSDLRLGRLIVWNDLAPGKQPLAWRGEIHPMAIASIRAGNRAARSDLKRQVTNSYFKSDLDDYLAGEAERNEAFWEWVDMYEQAWKDTVRMCMTPRAYMSGPSRGTSVANL